MVLTIVRIPASLANLRRCKQAKHFPPVRKEKNPIAHNPISPSSTTAFLRGWGANFPAQPDANQVESSSTYNRYHLAFTMFSLALSVKYSTRTLG